MAIAAVMLLSWAFDSLVRCGNVRTCKRVARVSEYNCQSMRIIDPIHSIAAIDESYVPTIALIDDNGNLIDAVQA